MMALWRFLAQLGRSIGTLIDMAIPVAREWTEIAGTCLKITICIVLVWPLAIILCSLFPGNGALVIVPLVTLLPPVSFIILMIVAANPLHLALGTAAVTLTDRGRALLRKLRWVVGIEVAVGIYFSLFPASNNWRLLPLIVLVITSLFLFEGKARNAAIALLVVLTIGGLFSFGSAGSGNYSPGVFAKSTTPPGYAKRFCDVRTLYDYRNVNPKAITITLQEGCYHDDILLPLAWENYYTQKSTAEGDYASVWCNGSKEPGEIRPYNEDMGNTMAYCRDRGEIVPHFSIEGKGTMTLTRTAEHKDILP